MVLIGGSLAFWLLLALPADAAWGSPALAYRATALGLCLVPAALTLVWAPTCIRQTGRSATERWFSAVLAFGSSRSPAEAWPWCSLPPFFREPHTPGFLTWVLAFYLFTLILETLLSVTGRPAADNGIVPAGVNQTAERIG